MSEFPPDMAAGIVEHMNDDHADAVLAMLRADGRAVNGCPDPRDATAARLVAITPHALDVEFTVADVPGRATVAFDPPIDPPGSVRARLVAMTKAARGRL